MMYGDVTCERILPSSPEAYICRWEDRHRLAMALFRDNKGSRTSERQGIPDAPGILGRRHAVVTIEPCA